MSNLVKDMPKLILDLDISFAMKNFSKKKYIPFVEKLSEVNSEIIEEIRTCFSSGESWEMEFTIAADAMAAKSREYVNSKFFLTRSRYEIDMAYALTCFVLPMILDINHPNCQRACEIITKQWAEHFPKMNSISAATKEEIQTGFKTQIFGIPLDK